MLDLFCQQAAQDSWIDDAEAEQDRACLGIHRLAHAPQLIQ
jgi:hypothetical protein